LTDDLLKHQDDLNKLIGALSDTWTFLLSKNQGIQNDEMRAIQELDQMVQRTISDLDSASRVAFDNAARTVEAIKRKSDELKAKIREELGAWRMWQKEPLNC
jgi:predicted  nucleic acid-binding Zn-ribbon protein